MSHAPPGAARRCRCASAPGAVAALASAPRHQGRPVPGDASRARPARLRCGSQASSSPVVRKQADRGSCGASHAGPLCTPAPKSPPGLISSCSSLFVLMSTAAPVPPYRRTARSPPARSRASAHAACRARKSSRTSRRPTHASPELMQRREQVLRRAPPPGELRYEHSVDPPFLRLGEHALTLAPRVLHP